MNPDLIEKLKSPDPGLRREAIIALGRSIDPAALEPLARIHRHDPVPELRELALKAGQYIHQRAPAAVAPDAPPETRRISWRTISRVLLATLTLLLIGLVYWFVDSGLYDTYRWAYKVWRIERNVQTLPNGQEYYIWVPGGDTPDGGWAVVVLLHGWGGRGLDMMQPEVLDMAGEERAILVAPTFGEYASESGDYDHHRARMKLNVDAMLDEVAKEHHISSDGVIVYGFSRGGMFATELLEGYAHRIYGVVAEGSPEIVIPGSHEHRPQCHFLYGEHDDRSQNTFEYYEYLRYLEYEATFEIIPGVGHEMTIRGVNWAAKMVREIYAN